MQRLGRRRVCTTQSTDLERQLQILAAPNIEAGVIAAEALEELLVDGEKPPRHGGGVHRLRGVLVPVPLPLRDAVPVELAHRGEVSKHTLLTSNSVRSVYYMKLIIIKYEYHK